MRFLSLFLISGSVLSSLCPFIIFSLSSGAMQSNLLTRSLQFACVSSLISVCLHTPATFDFFPPLRYLHPLSLLPPSSHPIITSSDTWFYSSISQYSLSFSLNLFSFFSTTWTWVVHSLYLPLLPPTPSLPSLSSLPLPSPSLSLHKNGSSISSSERDSFNLRHLFTA